MRGQGVKIVFSFDRKRRGCFGEKIPVVIQPVRMARSYCCEAEYSKNIPDIFQKENRTKKKRLWMEGVQFFQENRIVSKKQTP